jgi:hypothetical protein
MPAVWKPWAAGSTGGWQLAVGPGIPGVHAARPWGLGALLGALGLVRPNRTNEVHRRGLRALRAIKHF